MMPRPSDRASPSTTDSICRLARTGTPGKRERLARRSRTPSRVVPSQPMGRRTQMDRDFHPSFPARRCEAAQARVATVDRPTRSPRRGLMAEPWASVVSIVAPPGYGKTILLADWASRERRPVTWLTIDDYDNEPSVLLTYLAAALDRLAPIDPEVGPGDRLLRSRLLATAVPRLAAAVHQIGEPAILILDDAHRLVDRTVPRCPRRAHRPSAGRLPDRLGGARRAGPPSRQAPRPPGPPRDRRVRARPGRGRDEAHRRPAGRSLTLRPGDVLRERTEGWATGIYLATLAGSGRSIPAARL